MDIKNIFLIISTIIGFITPIIGIRAIFKGGFKPQRTTRISILFLMTLIVAELFAQGDKIGIYLALTQWTVSFIIFILSLKYGVGGTSKSDILVLILGIVSAIIWKTTSNPTLALYMSIITDLIGLFPTLYKSYKQPFTEDPKFYSSDTIAGFFNLLAQRSYLFQDITFPGYIFLINFTCMLLIIFRRKLTKKFINSTSQTPGSSRLQANPEGISLD